MFNLTRKGLWAHKVRFVLTGLAVVLGVAFMAGTMILTDTMGKTFDGLFATSNEGIDVVVHRTAAVDGDVGRRAGAGRRQRRSTRSAPSTASTPPPAPSRASPSSSTPTARPTTTDGIGGTIGVDWIDDERLNPFDAAPAAAPPRGRRGRARPGHGGRRGLGPRRHRHRARQGRHHADDHRRHRQLRRRRRPPRLHGDRRRRRRPPRRCSPSPAPTTASWSPPTDGITAAELADRDRGRRSARPTSRSLTGEADTADKQADVQGGPELLQHVPHGLRLHRPVRRHVHHLQHLLDHRRPAHAGDGDAPGHRRQPPPGARARCCSSRPSSAWSPRPSASVPAC